MLHDISLAKATEFSKTTETAEKAKSWFDSMQHVATEFFDGDRGQAVEFMQKWQTESFETLEEIERANELEDEGWYSGGGGGR